MQFGALSYAYSTNFGDEIQTLSASQYLPRIDHLVERDKLNRYGDCAEMFVIFNGWFNHQPFWPPPDSIHPLFVAFYANMPELLIDKKYASYFKRHEPIGCRSLATMEAFRKIGVEAYFSGCLTLTIEREPVERTNRIYMVDVEPELCARLVPAQVAEDVVHISHEGLPSDFTPLTKAMWTAARYGLRGMYKLDSGGSMLRGAAERLNRLRHSSRVSRAQELLTMYSAARLVITSRLHCALPCLALGTPVVLFRPGIESDPRFAGLRELVRFHSDVSRPIDIDWKDPEPNPDSYLSYARALRETCQSSVKRALQAGQSITPLSAEAALQN